jgi:hypothetical protein
VYFGIRSLRTDIFLRTGHEKEIEQAIKGELVKLQAAQPTQQIQIADAGVPVFDLDISGYGKLVINKGEPPVEAVLGFAQVHSLGEQAKKQIMDHVCSQSQFAGACGHNEL